MGLLRGQAAQRVAAQGEIRVSGSATFLDSQLGVWYGFRSLLTFHLSLASRLSTLPFCFFRAKLEYS